MDHLVHLSGLGFPQGRALQAALGRSFPQFTINWPRISPPGFWAVWMLTYHLPAMRSATCAAVKVAEPSAGLATLGNGTTTPAFAPGIAGPWMCPAVAGPVRPE